MSHFMYVAGLTLAAFYRILLQATGALYREHYAGRILEGIFGVYS